MSSPSNQRRSVTVEGYAHGTQPIPAASRRGPLLMSGGIHGIDRTSGKLASSLEDQVELMFDNLDAVVRAGGGTMEDVVKITVYAAVPEARELVNVRWVREFPDPESRPARHTISFPGLRAPMLVQCDAVAFIVGE